MWPAVISKEKFIYGESYPGIRMRREKLLKVTPFLKWAGGKRKLAEIYEQIGAFPRVFKQYYEPFVGGGAVFFRLQPEHATLSDSNPELINTYMVIKNKKNSLFELLEEHQIRHLKGKEQYYYKIRNIEPCSLNDVERAARTIFLNRTCFNGLYRVNQKGHFNVPYGRYKNPRILDINNLQRVSQLLQDTILKTTDFEKGVHSANKGDFVYLDPPYRPLNVTSSFTSYTEQNFDDEDQSRLAILFENLSNRGCLILESNSDTTIIRDLYSKRGIHISEVKAPRIINCKASGRGPITELVISNYAFHTSKSSQTILSS